MTTIPALARREHLHRARHSIRVIGKVSALNLRARMEYRADFFVSLFFGIIWQTSTLMFASVLLTRFKGGLGNFPASGVLLIIGMRLLSHGLYVLIFSNLAWLPRLVDEGRMDGYFLRPVPVFTQLLLSQFNVNAIGDIAVGASTLGVAITLVHLHWTVGKGLYMAAAVIGGLLVEAALQLMLSCLLLRSPGSRVLGSWVDELMSTFGNYPLSIVPKVVQGLFTFLLPLAFVAYFPVQVILGIAQKHGPMSVLIHWSPLAGVLLFMLARRVWAYSLRHYHSAGG
ncbi:MAG TPA: ABC-2 family transporter protein [Acidothermaceae bacterium]|nr:ABC-2 family transporter protein [Acidothermaceae bacterium]